MSEEEKLSAVQEAMQGVAARSQEVVGQLTKIQESTETLLEEFMEATRQSTGSTKRKLGRVCVLFKQILALFNLAGENQYLGSLILKQRVNVSDDLFHLLMETIINDYADVLPDFEQKFQAQALKLREIRVASMEAAQAEVEEESQLVTPDAPKLILPS